jgi:hypothetical protein
MNYMNESKANPNNLAQWAKWKRDGALGNILDAETQAIRTVGKPIIGIGTQLDANGNLISTLSIGQMPINANVTKPEVYVVVPGQPFTIGDEIKRSDLPEGSMTIDQAFPKKRS